MEAPSYLQREARTCLELAKIEQHSEMKLILMGMAVGWLSLAKRWKPPALAVDSTEPMEEVDGSAHRAAWPETNVIPLR